MSESKKSFRLSDDTIAIIRELVQLSLLTGTNVVDNFRAIVLSEQDDDGKLYPTEEYVEAFNSMVGDLAEKAQKLAEEMKLPQPTDGELN